MATDKEKRPKVLSSQADSDDGSDAHIPVSLRDPVLTMHSESAFVGNIPTIFVGVVDEEYTETMWRNHADRLARLFGIAHAIFIGEIKVRCRRQDQIDGEQLGRDMSVAIDAINSNVVGKIRIVGLGKSSAIGVHAALESLIRGWNLPWDQKQVQFVALGDSKENHYLNFCKSVCLKQVCHTVQFYSTMDYNDFGFLDLDNRKFGNLTNDQLRGLMARLHTSPE